MRMLFIPCAAFVVFSAVSARAEPVPDISRALVFVTGEREETRNPALLQGFRDVMVKMSGDSRLLAEPGLDTAFDPSAVTTFSYRDLMAGIPKHDEQGTRDRPFELTIDYAPEKIADALGSLGRKVWSADRPKLVLFIGVAIGPSHFIITDQGEPGSVQRQALLTSARRYGLPIAFPSRAALDAAGVTPASLEEPDVAALDGLAKLWGGDLAFAGHMRFSPDVLGWIAEWRVPADGTVYRWRIEGVNFDEAFRHAVRGTTRILSGNGAP
jgi:hypothetical protein